MSKKAIESERLTFYSSGEEDAAVCNDSGDVVAFINEADAYGHLFAAAPDLLAACKEALILCQNRTALPFMDLTATLRAAIKNAGG